MEFHKFPCRRARVVEEDDCPADGEHCCTNCPVYYDPLYYPDLHPLVFNNRKTVCLWLQDCFFHYTHWRHARAVDIGSCIIVEDPVFDKRVVLSLEAIASKDFHPMDCARRAEQSNPAWLYLSSTALFECFEDITVNTIRKSISVPRMKRSRADVITVAVKRFQTLAASVAPMTDQAVVESFEGSMTGTGNRKRRANIFRLFQTEFGDLMFPRLIRPHGDNDHYRSSVQAYNAELGWMDPESNVAAFKKRVRRIPLARLKPCVQLLRYSRRKCLLSAPREEMQEALRLSTLQRWKEFVIMPLGMISEILNCYVANVDLLSPYTICDVMDQEFSKDLCASVLPPMRSRRATQKRRNLRI